MSLLKKNWFYLFVIFYIFIELSLRNYAIDIIGTIHVLPYKIEALELTGRIVSSLGFSIFIFKSIEYIKDLEGLIKKALSFLLIFFSLFFIQKIIFENVDILIPDSKTESIYYSSLFKDGSYYIDTIEPHLPYSIKEKDDTGFKTFYGLSLFLYGDSEKIKTHVKERENLYVNSIISNYFDDKELEKLSSQSYSDVVLSHNTLMRYHVNIEKIFAFKLTEDVFKYTVAQTFVTRMRDEYRSNVRNYRRTNFFKLLEKVNNKEIELNLNTYNAAVKYIYNDYNASEVHEIFLDTIEHFILKEDKKGLSSSVRYGFQSINKKLDYEYFQRIMRAEIYAKSYEEGYKAFSFIFKNLTRKDYDDYIYRFMFSKNNAIHNFPLTSEFYYLDKKYKNWLIDDRRSLSNFLKFYSNSKKTKIAETSLVKYYIDEDSNFKNLLKKQFLQYAYENIQNKKNDHKFLGKSLAIPPLVLLVSDIALFLNISLLFSMIFINITGNKNMSKLKEKIIMISVFISLIFLSGINFGKNPFNKFNDNFIKPYTDIDNYKVVFTNWFINKNINMDKLYLSKINILEKPIIYIERYEAKKALEEKDILSIIYEDDLEK